MSLRPEISGFNLKKMEHLFGSKNADLIDKMKVHFHKTWKLNSEENKARANEIIEKIINGEITKGHVETEDEIYIFIMIAFAYFEQEHLSTDSNCWDSYFIDYAEAIQKKIPEGVNREEWKKMSSYFDFFLGKRPYFGKNQDSEWTFYGYLTNQEVNTLLNYFEQFPQLKQDKVDFGIELHQYLKSISSAEKDLWFFCQ